MAKTTVKNQEQAQKINHNLNNAIERAKDWDEFAASIPTLKIVDNLYGKDKDGLTIAVNPQLKLATHHFADGTMQTVPIVRTDSYKELAHDYVYGTIHNILDQAGLGHKVLRSQFSRLSGELHTDIVLDKAYKMDEDVFERKMNVGYTDGDDNNRGLYRPIIRVNSSFVKSSSVQMGLLRALCSNGLIGVELGDIAVPLVFSHIGEVVNKFNSNVQNLITGLFEKNIVENMMMRLDAQSVSFAETVTWMLANIGKQATIASIDQFHLADKQAEDFVSKWVAYNMASWAISHVVESVTKRNKAQASLSRFIA